MQLSGKLMPDDPILRAIMAAVGVLQAGGREEARARLATIWSEIEPNPDPFHECTLAHFMADTQDDPAEELEWDLRALGAAERLIQDGARAPHGALSIEAFFPSLHLNAGDAYLRLGDKANARCHLEAALDRADHLPADGYGAMIRGGLDRLATRLAG